MKSKRMKMSAAPRKRHLLLLIFALATLLSLANLFYYVASSGKFSELVRLSVVQSEPSCNATAARPQEVSFLQMYNAVEDAKLQLYLASEKHKVKAMIYYLAYKDGIKRLTRSIELLHKHFNSQYRYPLVIFHEADFLPLVESVRHLGYLHDKKTSCIFFQQVDLSVPQWHLKKFGQPPKWACATRSISYRSMCRFQAKLIYEQKVMRHFDHYWRLDDDSTINAKVSFDVFDALKTGGFTYGFYYSAIDTCADYIYSVTEDYMKSRNITPTFFNKLREDEIFFNNFEISSLKFWRSPQYLDFIEHIDSLGGIYTHRWGDAPIKTLALSMFVPLKEIHRFRGIAYKHPMSPADVSHFLE